MLLNLSGEQICALQHALAHARTDHTGYTNYHPSKIHATAWSEIEAKIEKLSATGKPA